MAKTTKAPVRTQTDFLASLAEGLEAAAAAVREMEASEDVDKSGDSGTDLDGVAEPASKPGAKATVKAVVAKSAAGGKKKAPPAPTFEDIKVKMTDLLNTKGKEVVKSLLSEFGVAKLVDIDAESYTDISTKIDEAIAEEENDEDEDDLFGE